MATEGMLSEHFSKAELCCPCGCGKCDISSRLVDGLEEFRTKIGGPVIVDDGYRCESHNAAVGGVPHSEHPMGMAADIRVPGKSLQEMYDVAKTVEVFARGGIGVYDAKVPFIHVDVRFYPARWARVGGKYVGIEALVER